MPNDVIVVVNIDARPTGTENLDILLLSTEGEGHRHLPGPGGHPDHLHWKKGRGNG